jgi:hypothetical protein
VLDHRAVVLAVVLEDGLHVGERLWGMADIREDALPAGWVNLRPDVVEDGAGDSLRVLGGVVNRDEPAHGGPDEPERGQAQRVADGLEVFDIVPEVVAVGGPHSLAAAADISE